jgi:myo-inositol-1(or 4)-monophosphatase
VSPFATHRPPIDGRIERLRAIALDAARTGAKVVANAPRPDRGDEKAAGDYVTDVDRASEAEIRRLLSDATPDIPILGEEAGGTIDAPVYWAVDPLDGTRNYLLGFPVVGVSVAAVRRPNGETSGDAAGGDPIAGAVVAPFLDLEYSAGLGLGATCNGRPIAVSERPVAQAVLATGFPFRAKHLLARHLSALRSVVEEAEDVRRAGAASLDLAWTAAGVFDGYFELGLNVWDVAGGGLLVREAGGIVTDWDGGDGYLGGDILAGSPQAHASLLRIVTDRKAD